MNLLPTHPIHVVPSSASLHCLDYDDVGDSIHMLGWGSFDSNPITFDPNFGEDIEKRGQVIGRMLF